MLVSPWYMAGGRVVASPAIINEKNTPMDNAEPALKNVPRIPDAAPRSPGGTLFMIAVVFGAENMPEPIPLTTSRIANHQ